jgi:hypothetical protein
VTNSGRLHGESRAGGGLVLLTGGSSVGKTRSMYEAAGALRPDWWLVHPPAPAPSACGGPAGPETRPARPGQVDGVRTTVAVPVCGGVPVSV